MHGDMFQLCLQPSSGQLVGEIRYNYCAYDMGSHKVYGIPYRTRNNCTWSVLQVGLMMA